MRRGDGREGSEGVDCGGRWDRGNCGTADRWITVEGGKEITIENGTGITVEGGMGITIENGTVITSEGGAGITAKSARGSQSRTSKGRARDGAGRDGNINYKQSRPAGIAGLELRRERDSNS